jgi:hypothetical protein
MSSEQAAFIFNCCWYKVLKATGTPHYGLTFFTLAFRFALKYIIEAFGAF